MDGKGDESLAHFCVVQRQAFIEDEWLARSAADGQAVAFAAKYLSMTSWYGHEEELERIAARLCPRIATVKGLSDESRSTDFDWSRFSTAVRTGIARQVVGRASLQNGHRKARAQGS